VERPPLAIGVTTDSSRLISPKQGFAYTPHQYCLLPVPGLIEDVVAVTAHSLAAEQGREATANWDHLLWDTHLSLGLGLSDDELSNLYNESDIEEHVTEAKVELTWISVSVMVSRLTLA
jgi:hypothetical protein